jgi:hypothetical protein
VISRWTNDKWIGDKNKYNKILTADLGAGFLGVHSKILSILLYA